MLGLSASFIAVISDHGNYAGSVSGIAPDSFFNAIRAAGVSLQTLAASVSELLAKPPQSRQIAATLARVLHRTA